MTETIDKSVPQVYFNDRAAKLQKKKNRQRIDLEVSMPAPVASEDSCHLAGLFRRVAKYCSSSRIHTTVELRCVFKTRYL